MNLDLIKTRMKAAAEAAKQFQGFDSMAAQDEYIHSDSLNVKGRNSREKSSSITPSATENITPQEAFSFLTPELQLPGPHNDIESQHKDVFRTPLEHPDDMDSSDDDDEDLNHLDDHHNDPILKLIQSKKARSRADSGGSDQSQNSNNKRNTNRFMEDLDARLSRSNSAFVEEAPSTENSKHAKAAAAEKSNTASWDGWLQSARSRSLRILQVGDPLDGDNERVPFFSPLTRTPVQSQNLDDEEEDEEEHKVVVSSSVLGAAEQAELERLRQKSAGAHSPLSILIQLVEQHPQYAFIVFTLVLACFVYFYSRHRGTQDDIT